MHFEMQKEDEGVGLASWAPEEAKWGEVGQSIERSRCSILSGRGTQRASPMAALDAARVEQKNPKAEAERGRARKEEKRK